MNRSLSHSKVKYLVLSVLQPVSPNAQGLDIGDIYSKIGFATNYLSLVTLLGRWAKQGLIAGHKGKRGYSREVYIYFRTLNGVSWLNRNKERLPVDEWLARADGYSWSSKVLLKGQAFRSIIERCEAIDAAHAATATAFNKER